MLPTKLESSRVGRQPSVHYNTHFII